MRRKGFKHSEAILEVGVTLLRLILMITIDMILGMILVEFSVGVTIIGGLSTSTMLTLVIV
jgi:multidrug efflux pump subunit AcrB